MHTATTYARSLLLLGALLLVMSGCIQPTAAQPLVSGSVAGENLVPTQPSTSTATATAAVATADKAVTHAENARVPQGAAWTQHYFPSSDGSDVELHADVLLPEGLAAGEKVPVILVVGPYLGHSGGQVLENHAHTGPSLRFHDLITGTNLFERGYALVMVDGRGFGGSSGCVDFAGRGEQADVKAAIDWAATQPWSTGAVGMYGKSADAITALIGNNLNHDALKAVVAQEPIWDLYRNFRSNGVPRATIVSVANIYNTIATLPQMPDDDERYRTNAEYEKINLQCYFDNLVNYQIADPESDYWMVRDLATLAQGTDTPLLFTQGFLEWNTEAEAMEEFLTNHQGPQRGWLGPWDHKRGNERTADGQLEMGREGWFDEVISFYDQYLKGIEPAVAYPAYVVQDSTGVWRGQDTWPVVDDAVTIALGGGSYLDNGLLADPAAEAPNRFFVWSAPLGQPIRITGTPRVSLEIEGHGNVMFDLYDVAPDGSAVMFDRQVAVVKTGTIRFELRSTDWTLPVGHALAVEIGTIQPGFALDNDWIDTPSYETITVHDARLELALDDPTNDTPTPGDPAAWLTSYRLLNTEQLSPGTPSFTLPTVATQTPAPGAVPAGLERFYAQELTFGPCEGFATTALDKALYVEPFECARLEVPFDYDAPQGETMQIGVLRLPALGEPSQRIGSMVINPGGPGGSGMQVAVLATLTGQKDGPLLQQFDLVGFDPRGVGASIPAIHCFTNEERDQGQDQTTLLGTSGEWTADDTRELMEKCAEGSGGKEVLTAVGTRDVARDMDVLRAALGDEKLTFFGQSYGTRLGAVYAEMFPQNVRAMVLDGALDPRQGSAERRLALHTAFQRSFDLLAEFCAQSPDCPLGTDPSMATARFQELFQPLVDNPVPAGEGRTANFFQATGGVIAGLYLSEAWPLIIDGIAQLKNEGRGDKLLTLSDSISGRDPDGVWSNLLEANLAINCNDEERRTPAQETELRRKIAEVNPILDTGRAVEGVTRDACEFWPGEPTLGFPHAQNIEGLPATLIISITGDPSTPYAAGVSLADSLGGTLLTVEGERHTVALEGTNPCVNEIVADYLINLMLPADGTTCTL